LAGGARDRSGAPIPDHRPLSRPLARFGIVLLPESFAGFAALCHEVEEAGFDLLGIADSQSVIHRRGAVPTANLSQ